MLAQTHFVGAAACTVRTLPLAQATALHSALETVVSVIAGFQCQPRFQAERSHRGNDAGNELEALSETLFTRMDELVEMVRSSRPTEAYCQQHRLAFLLRHEIGTDDAIAEVAGAAVQAIFQDQF